MFMSLIKKILAPFRPKLREALQLDLTDERLNILTDRLGIAESTLHWRLYGLPSRLINLKLEQARIYAGSNDVEAAIADLKQAFNKVSPDNLERLLPEILTRPAGSPSPDQKSIVVENSIGAETTVLLKNLHDQAVTLIRDTSDLFFRKAEATVSSITSSRVTTLEVPAIASGILCDSNSLHLAWISSSLERFTPIQAIVLLKRIRDGLLPDGKCAGIFCDYTIETAGTYFLDIRRLRPINRASIEFLFKTSGFSFIEFRTLDEGSQTIIFWAQR